MEERKYEYRPYADGGTLRATKSKKGPKSPDYWGDIAIDLNNPEGIQVINGLTCIRVNGWKRQDKNGNVFLSLAVNRMSPEGAATKTRRERDDDDIPF